MGYIRKRKLPSGKIRWQVIWDTDVVSVDKKVDERSRMTAMFDTLAEAKDKVCVDRAGEAQAFRGLHRS